MDINGDGAINETAIIVAAKYAGEDSSGDGQSDASQYTGIIRTGINVLDIRLIGTASNEEVNKIHVRLLATTIYIGNLQKTTFVTAAACTIKDSFAYRTQSIATAKGTVYVSSF